MLHKCLLNLIENTSVTTYVISYKHYNQRSNSYISNLTSSKLYNPARSSKYHSLLEFRAFVATRAVKDVYQEVFGLSHSDKSSQFRVNHATGIMYWIAVHELEAFGKERDIIIGNEISESSLRAYEHHLQCTCFLHPRPSTVHEIVADGHAKVHVKCDNVLRHSGKPKADKRIKPYGHGWFMLVHPKNLRILWARAMEAPEGNDILETALRADGS